MVIQVEQNGYTSGEEDEQFMDALEKSMEIFVNRMKSDSLRGRSIGGDSSVQTLFMTLSAMHTELVKNMQKLDDNRGLCRHLNLPNILCTSYRLSYICIISVKNSQARITICCLKLSWLLLKIEFK